jgi:hypothetical protein
LDFIQAQIDFNNWFIEIGSKTNTAVEFVDTTQNSESETADQIACWIRSRLNLSPDRPVQHEQK